MKSVLVESTSLASVAYNAEHGLLQIQFRDRTTYQYSSVPENIHEALLRAPSKGTYFNRFIRGKFPHVRI